MAKYKAKKTTEFNKEIKSKKIKPQKEISENEQEVKRFICILIIIVLLIVGLFLITKVTNNKEVELSNINIQYNNISVGMILNRDYEDYYVLVYNFNNDEYTNLVSVYRDKNDKKLFTVDMNDKINEKFISNDKKSNNNAKIVDDFMFGETTLLHIKDNKVIDYIIGEKNINKVLKK